MKRNEFVKIALLGALGAFPIMKIAGNNTKNIIKIPNVCNGQTFHIDFNHDVVEFDSKVPLVLTNTKFFVKNVPKDFPIFNQYEAKLFGIKCANDSYVCGNVFTWI